MKLLNTKEARDYLGIKSEATFKTYRQKGFILSPHGRQKGVHHQLENVYLDKDLDKARKPINNYIKNVGIWGRVKEQKPIEYGNKQGLFNQFLTNPKRKIA